MREIKFRAWYKTNSKMLREGFDVGYDGNVWCNHFSIKEYVILQQYTGLKDKNGKEIYEGDIVKQRFNNGPEYMYEIGYMIWNQLNARFSWYADGGDGYGLQEKDDENREVIGNIYENPELLKDK